MATMCWVWTCSIILSSNSFAKPALKQNDWTIQTDSLQIKRIVKSVLKRNKKLQASEIETLLQKKFKAERYLTAKINLDPAERTIRVSSSRKYLILFEGNSSLSKRFLKNSVDLNSITSSEDTIKDDLELRIKQAYTKNGFNDVKIETKDVDFKESNVRRLVFEIDEGLVYSFDKITMGGSFSKNKKYYINFLKTKSSKLIKSGKFSKPDIENGLNNLITHLKNLGYLEASYTGLRIEPKLNSKSKVHIYFDLYEGQPVRADNIRFIGNKSVDSEWLQVLLGFQSKEALNFYKLEEGIKRIYEYYLSTGYLEVEINPEQKDFVDLNLEKRRADITIEIIESEKVVVGEIEVIGLSKTKSYVVTNILGFGIGDVLTVEKMALSKSRLNLSGLFSKVDMTYDEEYKEARKIVIEVEEKAPGVFQLGFGARFNQRALSLKGYTGVLYRNLGGTARAINTRLELQSRINEDAYPEYRAFISYYEPYIFSKFIRGRVTADATENIFEITSERVTIFRSLGVDFVLENNFNRHIRAAWTVLGIDFTKEFQIRSSSPSNNEIREQIGFFGPSIQFDYRNNILLPTKGYFASAQAEYGSPNLGTRVIADGSTDVVEYVRTEASYTKYSTVNPSLVFVNTLRGGWLRNLSNNTASFPKSRGFFLGGSSTIRGFDPSDGVNERIPSDEDLGVDIGGGGVLEVPGNAYYYLIKAEARFPLFNEFWGSLFYDGGSVLIDQLIQKDAYRDAAGIGLRWNTPIGAVSVDLGFKLDRDKSRGESLNRVHINIGTF